MSETIEPTLAEIAALIENEERHIKKKTIRAKIKEKAGDTQSILGTTNDAVQLLLLEFAKFSRSLSEAQSLAELRASAEAASGVFDQLLASVEAQTVQLSCESKGPDKVLSDLSERATAVSNVLKSS